MPKAAMWRSMTDHPGVVMGGVTSVLINGWPAARVTDKHVCLMPPSAGPHTPSTIVKGSTSVLIAKQPAARVGDSAACGAKITTGSLNVSIGG